MIAAFQAHRHSRYVDAEPLSNLSAREFRHRDRTSGAPAQPRNQEIVYRAKTCGEVIRLCADRSVVNHDDLMASRNRAECAEIKQQLRASVEWELDLLPEIATR